MRKFLRYLPLLLVIPSLLLVAFAHPGRTDSNGGHTDYSTGEYHYHHGYSAHDHYDMDGDGDIDCPYDFGDKTDSNNHSTTNSKKYTEKTINRSSSESNISKKNTLKDTLVTIFLIFSVLVCVPIFVFFCFAFVPFNIFPFPDTAYRITIGIIVVSLDIFFIYKIVMLQ